MIITGKKSYFPVTLVIVVLILSACQSKDDPLFRLISPEKSGVHFNNEIIEDDTTNILEYEYVYNGGGVAVGDFNNDGFQDLFFTANMVANRLYLNRGELTFDDVTDLSGTAGEDKWYTGVSVVDINGDGWMDIYICASRSSNPEQRKNELYVNQGLNENGIPVFTEQAVKYGLDDSSYSTHAAFFDYDNDGDLDMYLLVSDQWQKKPGGNSSEEENHPNQDKLFENEWRSHEQHPLFKDVSKQAGILKPGYGLGVNIADINQDGWKDIYAANDYSSNDLLWINNGDGTFTDKASIYFKHTSFSAMGTDIQDINNDGLADVFALDMLPETNYRKKTMTNPNNYSNYARGVFRRYDPQFTRNTLQLNQGPSFISTDSIAPPVFSEIAYLAGVAATDWSWGALLADFDNDGFRDLIVTNGTPRDKTDKDFVNLRDQLGNIIARSSLLDSIPEIKIPNYIYKNKGNLTFDNVTNKWGLTKASFSNGVAWSDLDNDGDLDIIINNINQNAFLYKNTQEKDREEKNNWIQIHFVGDTTNKQGLGAHVDLYFDNGKHQMYENTTYRGYLSSVENVAHFGLGQVNVVDSVVVVWPSGKKEISRKIKANQRLKFNYTDARDTESTGYTAEIENRSLFHEVTREKNVSYNHDEFEYNDFQFQRLLPHKFSQYGPSLAVGDVDGNDTQDLFIGGSYNNEGTFLLQKPDGNFEEKKLLVNLDGSRKTEDRGALFFDADNDGDPDLFVTSGSVENPPQSRNYQDRLYQNDGNGNFIETEEALPDYTVSSSAVKAADYDRDGDLDLFIGGRVSPRRYPVPVSSYILRNDSENGEIKFTDVTSAIAEDLIDIGLVTDALWSDFNNDGWVDLVVVGEWMPISFFENREGDFVNITESTGISDKKGWWNSISSGDFDHDGDMDYIAGNLGLNSPYKANRNEPVRVYAGEFSESGIWPSIITQHVMDAEGAKREFPVHDLIAVASQLPQIKQQFVNHHQYGSATIEDILSPNQMRQALIFEADHFSTSYIENIGNSRFEIEALPMETQFAPVYGMLVDDFNSNGYLDLLLTGNEFGAEARIGKYDALNGLLLQGKGNGDFDPLKNSESGFFVPGDGKALVKLKGTDNSYIVAASQNNGPLKLFQTDRYTKVFQADNMDQSAVIHYQDGSRRRVEFYYGSSFLSSSGRFIPLNEEVRSLEVTDFQGETRTVNLSEGVVAD